MFLLRNVRVALMAAAAAFGAAVFMTINLFYQRRVWTPEDYRSFKEEEEERRQRQVLVLGLDGAGKSSVLQQLNGAGSKRMCAPTRGFNFIRLHTPSCEFDFLEIGGGEDLRTYWADFLARAHILFFVVDSSDRTRLPLAKDELHRLLSTDTRLPVVVLGNKQDKPGAVGESELLDALSLGSVSEHRKLLLLQLNSVGESESFSLQNLKEFLIQLEFDPN
ncbi:ADP-ribosylation factor-like protein 9 [Bagarius yarrelli]|uniref:ADP-ribosylation factor-like protein 9 n=1 Tax=Bagarius yarrelli TaxID=175774 RepID=A0A556UZ04_BAGYA|nr:ADP-ribosylation factor-like protein 9 [Bagarius yarrelli]